MTSFISLGDALAPDGDIKTGPFGTILKASEYTPTGVPLLSVGEIRRGTIQVSSNTPRVDSAVLDRLPQYILREGDVVFARKGAIERTAHIGRGEHGWFLGSDGLRARPGAQLLGRFLAFQLQTMRVQSWLKSHATGSTMPSLSQATLERIPIWVPPLSEQQAIADVLGALDDKIAANFVLTTTSDELVRTLFSLTHQSDGELSLGDICTSPRHPLHPSEAPGVYVGLEHLPRRHIWLHETGDASEVGSAKSSFERGDVLFGKLRPYFHKVVSAPVSGICSTDILVLRAKNPALQGFILAAASSDSVVGATTAASAGTKMPRTSWSDVSACTVPWPGEAKALPLSARVMQLRDATEATARESHTLAALRDTLLPALMDGTLRVKDAISQAEEVL